jgi:hypothetical protein
VRSGFQTLCPALCSKEAEAGTRDHRDAVKRDAVRLAGLAAQVGYKRPLGDMAESQPLRPMPSDGGAELCGTLGDGVI